MAKMRLPGKKLFLKVRTFRAKRDGIRKSRISICLASTFTSTSGLNADITSEQNRAKGLGG